MTLSLSFRLAAVLSCVALLAACSTINDTLAGDKVDYKSTSATRTAPLEVPPDLTQLTREARYQQPGGAVSASTFQTATAAEPSARRLASTGPSVAASRVPPSRCRSL